jgi:hypothetical protein
MRVAGYTVDYVCVCMQCCQQPPCTCTASLVDDLLCKPRHAQDGHQPCRVAEQIYSPAYSTACLQAEKKAQPGCPAGSGSHLDLTKARAADSACSAFTVLAYECADCVLDTGRLSTDVMVTDRHAAMYVGRSGRRSARVVAPV